MMTQYYNSVHEYTKIMAQREGCAECVIRKQMDKVGFEFTNNTIIYPNELPDFLSKERIPLYILKTKKDSRIPTLNRTAWDLMLYLSGSQKYFDKIWEEDTIILKSKAKNDLRAQFRNLDWVSTNFTSIRRIAKDTGYSVYQIIEAFKKIRFYFCDFHHKPTEIESINRKYKFSRSYTKDLPPRSEWKKIIESVINPNIEINFPIMINKEQYLRWKKLVAKHLQTQPSYIRPMDLSQYRKMIQDVALVLEVMNKGKEKWDQIKFDYDQYLLYITKLRENKKGFLLDCIRKDIEKLRQLNENLLKENLDHKIKDLSTQEDISLYRSELDKISLIEKNWSIVEGFTEDILEEIVKCTQDRLSVLVDLLLEIIEETEIIHQSA